MARTRPIDNSQDIIDSRDVIARISELEGRLEDEHNSQVKEDEANNASAADDNDKVIVITDFEEWLKLGVDNGEDECVELVTLRAFAEEASGVADWRHGEAFIRDSYFEEYAWDLAEDLYGKELSEPRWPFDCIDWGRAADALLADYSAYDFDGVTYYARG